MSEELKVASGVIFTEDVIAIKDEGQREDISLTVNHVALEPFVEDVEEKPVKEVLKDTKHTKSQNTNKVAVYALRSLTLPSGTIQRGYSWITKTQYDKVSYHKAIRIASKEEIETYLN